MILPSVLPFIRPHLSISSAFINGGPVALPSHYFVVVLRCANLNATDGDGADAAAACADSADVLALVLPNVQSDVNCWVRSVDVT